MSGQVTHKRSCTIKLKCLVKSLEFLVHLLASPPSLTTINCWFTVHVRSQPHKTLIIIIFRRRQNTDGLPPRRRHRHHKTPNKNNFFCAHQQPSKPPPRVPPSQKNRPLAQRRRRRVDQGPSFRGLLARESACRGMLACLLACGRRCNLASDATS